MTTAALEILFVSKGGCIFIEVRRIILGRPTNSRRRDTTLVRNVPKDDEAIIFNGDILG